MKKLFFKSLLSLAIVTSTFTILPTAAYASWKHDSTGWWYQNYFSYPYYDLGWNNIDKQWYYFDSNGYMAHDTVVNGYSIDSSGARQSKVSGSYYWGSDLLHMDFHANGIGYYHYADPVFNTDYTNTYSTINTTLDNLNNEYSNFLLLHAFSDDSYSYIDFPLNAQFKQFKAKLGLPKKYQEGLDDGTVRIYADDKIVYETEISSGDVPKDISVDLTGKQRIRFFFLVNKNNHYGSEVGFFNGEFIK